MDFSTLAKVGLAAAAAYVALPHIRTYLSDLGTLSEAARRNRYYRRTPDHIVNRDQTVRLTSYPRFGGGVPITNETHKPHHHIPARRKDDLPITERVSIGTGLVGGEKWRREF